jgi:hypothetical protein
MARDSLDSASERVPPNRSFVVNRDAAFAVATDEL